MQNQGTQHEHQANATSSASEYLTKTSQRLDELIKQVRQDLKQVKDPKAQALFETTAEVLLGLKKAYDDYHSGSEEAWR